MALARLDAGDLDLIVATLKEFTSRETPLERRLQWDTDDT